MWVSVLQLEAHQKQLLRVYRVSRGKASAYSLFILFPQTMTGKTENEFKEATFLNRGK